MLDKIEEKYSKLLQETEDLKSVGKFNQFYKKLLDNIKKKTIKYYTFKLDMKKIINHTKTNIWDSKDKRRKSKEIGMEVSRSNRSIQLKYSLFIYV